MKLYRVTRTLETWVRARSLEEAREKGRQLAMLCFDRVSDEAEEEDEQCTGE